MLTSVPRSPIRTSITLLWPRVSECTPRGQSRIRKIWELRSSARSPLSNAANRRSSMSLPTLAKEFGMKQFHRPLIAIFGLLMFGPANFAGAQTPVTGDAANGNRIYLAVGCFTCHGRSGQGGSYNGPAPILARTALPFVGFNALNRDPANDMPAYSDAVLSDQDIADVYAFLESLPGPRSPRDI